MKKEMDVFINHYPKTTKGHEIGIISFRNDIANLIDSERIELQVDSESIYFIKSRDGHGLKLGHGKIQLWTLAWIAKDWQGEYPLVFDIQKGCYKINRCDRQEFESEPKIGSRLGEPVQYTPHKNETPVKKTAPGEKVVINILLNKLIEYIDNNKPEAAKNLATSIINLLNG